MLGALSAVACVLVCVLVQYVVCCALVCVVPFTLFEMHVDLLYMCFWGIQDPRFRMVEPGFRILKSGYVFTDFHLGLSVLINAYLVSV